MLTKNLNLRDMIVTAICLAGVIMFASCGKEKGSDSEKAILLLSKIERSNGERVVYEYDNQNRMTKCIEYGTNGVPDWTSTYTYNAQGDLIEYKDDEIEVVFSKNGNIITFVDDEGGSSEIELNDQGLPVKSTYQWGNWYKSTTTFTWQNGNLTRMEMVDEWGVNSETVLYTFTYDDKKAPLYYCKTPKWFLCEEYDIENNKKSHKEGTLEVTYEYTYNSDGFPVTRKASDSSITDTFLYTKK